MGETDCAEYRIGLGVYALGRLPGAEADELSAHLHGCPPCRAELAELRDVADLLTRGFAQSPDDFTQPEGGVALAEGGFAQLDGGFAQDDGGFAQDDGGFAQLDDGFADLEGGFAQFEGPGRAGAVAARKGAGRRPRTGASSKGLSGACAYGSRGRRRSP